MKKIFIILLLSITLSGCSSDINKSNTLINEQYIENIVMDKEYIILDVRTKTEYDELHIVNANNIPYDKITEEINLDKEKIIFVYCRSGNRSKIAFETLSNLGYKVYDLGGINNIDLNKE